MAILKITREFARAALPDWRRSLVASAACLLALSLSPQQANAQAASCPANLTTEDLIDHDLSVSYCELCGTGTVRIEIENPFDNNDDADFSEIVITEDLGASGLTYVPNSTDFTAFNQGSPPDVEPVVVGSDITWTLPAGYELETRPNGGGGGSVRRLVLEFDVRSSNGNAEALVNANRNINASLQVTPSCDPGYTLSDATGANTLPLREPEPEIVLTGRNVDAGQGAGQYTGTVFGHEGDDVIWRVEVINDGDADLQDLILTKDMQPGNFEMDYVCDAESDANSAANGGGGGSCVGLGGVTNYDLDTRALFGGGANPYIAAPAGDSGYYYFVGRITDSCTNRTTQVNDVEWGCEVEAPAGGIVATSNAVPALLDSADLRTLSDEDLDVDVDFIGAFNAGQPIGSRGRVRIRITNNSGGTIRGDITDGLRLRNLLPVEYVVDPTFTPTASMDPAYGNAYEGMLDTVQWLNPEPGTVPYTNATSNAAALANTEPRFEVTSSTVNSEFNDHRNLLRHGDTLTIIFGAVLVDDQYYDREAWLEEREERPNSDPANTDPTESFQVQNELEIWYEDFCPNGGTDHNEIFNDTDTANPEDIDPDVSVSDPVYILTNDDILELTVDLDNNGGHDAENYFAYVTFGNAMSVVGTPGSCSVETNPPADRTVWQDPVALPGTGAVYRCSPGRIGPGQTRSLTFDVEKNDAATEDDLTFRVDVIGDITLSDGTPLRFPDPLVRGDGVLPDYNNYTVDALWWRVVGYNLLKGQRGICTENQAVAGDPDSEIQIGEECEFSIESGGWFGFDTFGFNYIAVNDIQVVDNIPNGQGYISDTDPFAPGYSTTAIEGVSFNPPPAPLDEAPFDWTHNVTDAERIEERDHWFRADVTTRLLNDPQDTVASPNQHAALSRNVLTSTFDAIFESQLTGDEVTYELDVSTYGYPPEFRRRVDLTVTEPNLIVVQEVCNETLYGAGPACTNFVPLADDGDAYDTYIYRVTVTNEAAAGGVARAPAYDVTVTTDTDPSDLVILDPLETDGLDNDGNAEIDEAAGEGQIVPDNVFLNGTPAQIITEYTHSDALLRIDAGDSVIFYYRVDPYDDVAPLQTLTNSAVATYDSLEGPTGNQSDPTGANGEIGGARQYTSAPGDAAIQIIPVEVEPKQILQLSNTPMSASPGPQPVSVGEEIEFELRTLIPVAQLRNFVVRDELPAGMRCSEAPDVNLDAAPYDEAGFVPGGTFTPTCTETEVVWDFGNQTVTQTQPGQTRYDFGIQFIARIDNAAANVDGYVIGNGGAYTTTNVSYIDQADNLVVIDFDAAEVIVNEPLLELTKEFSVEETDAADILTVTITAANNGSATAYNPRFLDDLSGLDLGYVGNVAGDNPPQVDTATYGNDSPLFFYDPGYPIAVGEQVSFTFEVQVADPVQPLQVLENTVQADWTSLPGEDTALNSGGTIGTNGDVDGMRNGALPNAADAVNDYEAEASDSVYVSPLAINKTDLDTTLPPAIGAHKRFEVQLDLPEGASNGVRLDDDLAFGNASYVFADNADFDVTYEFVGIASINGNAPDASAFNALPTDGAAGVISWDIGTVSTEVENDTAVNDINPYIRITYRARVNNDLDTNLGSMLQNSATLYYTNGDSGGQEALNATTAPVQVVEPSLTATKDIANVTPGKQPADPIALGDLVQYTLTIPNLGNSIAHDTTITDTLPPELALDSSYTPTAQVDGIDVPGFVAIPAGSPNGPLVWGAGNGDGSLDVAAGATLEVTYQVVLEAPADENIALTNIVWVDWTSLDDNSDYERTGDGCPTITAPDDYCFGPASADGTPYPVGPPQALIKANTQDTATIGEEFAYRITIPGTPHPLPLYDVRILDDLNAAAADLTFVDAVQVSGPGSFVPVNTGDAKNVVLEDTTTGIDIPVGQQVVFDIIVRTDDTPTNVAGLTFTNTAAYTYNRLNDAPATVLPGDPYTTQPMTIVEPDELVMDKSGPPQMQYGVPGNFTLDVHNIGDSPAFNVTVYDQLPSIAQGGTCDAPPANVTAQVFEADGTTAVSPVLVEDTDFAVTFAGDPDCSLSIAILTPAGSIGVDQRLLLNYDVYLDTDSEQSITLTNVAGATEWFSLDVSDADAQNYARTYTRVLTDGTVGTADHEDAHDVLVFNPVLVFEKTVVNVSRGDDPGTVATPGERLRYTLRIENTTDTPLDGFSIVDELDALNAAPAFLPGSLVLLTYPDGADAGNTNANGGAAGTGLLDIRDLSLGGTGDEIVVEFQVDLAPVIANDTYVMNQSEAMFAGYPVAISDDPYVNGVADPTVPGDEDPTQVLIESAPAFTIEKTATYLGGNPTVLLAGDTLRYTITARNTGTDNATGVDIFDQLPANVDYVAGSTTLNGDLVPDVNAALPLIDGIPINAPQDTTPGVLNAQVADNIATVTFDVVVYPDVPDGTIIENQAFLNAVGYGIADQPSDDPRTEVFQDPTRDVVGNYPLLFAEKSAALEVDLGSPGIVDPGDVLRYTINVYNSGNIAATDTELSDLVPANVTYVPDSTTLNGYPVEQPDGGAFPLEAQIPISSADLTPPLPRANEGVLSPGEAATIQFDMRVNDDVPTGTLITNQATVYSAERPNLLTDGDGNPATGPEPTVVIVGEAQQLQITKEVAVVGGGPAIAGATLEYTVAVQNIGNLPALYVVIADNLDDPIPGYLQYVDMSATLNGQDAGVTYDGTSMLVADYFNEYGPLEPGENVILRFRAIVNPNLEDGTTIANTAEVTWNDPPQYASATATIDVGGIPNAGILSGSSWHDSDYDDTQDPVEAGLEGWTVTLFLDGTPVRSTETAVDGTWTIMNVPPNYSLGQEYSLEFRAPGAGMRTATLGVTDSDFSNGRQHIGDIEVQGGSNLRDLNLPIDPNGIVYDSVTRAPVGGATLTMLDARRGIELPPSCFADPVQQGQVTTANGYYKFDLNFSDPACPSGANYTIGIEPPPDGYVPGASELIPPTTNADTLPFNVPSCPGSVDDAVFGTSQHCEVLPSEFAPPPSAPARSPGTLYHAHLIFNSSQAPGSSQVFNNHIPVDPQLGGAVAVTKTTPMLNVTRGQMVPYVITVSNSFGADLYDVNIVDRFPGGFQYVEGSARFDNEAAEPAVVGRELVWQDLVLAENGDHTIKLLLAVGAGVSEGEFTNRAQAMNALTGGVMSEEASATVRIVPDPTFDCTDVTGKVYDDANRNGYQDEGEGGIPGVRVVTARGLAATTDGYGRYHITCAIVPNESRGSNFVLKLDDRSLPSGFRASTRPVQVQRATRGKALRVNFGASIHRVVGLDVADPVFEAGTAEMREQWKPRVDLLLTELDKAPAVLRISYLADVEDPALVERRLDRLKGDIMRAWEGRESGYELVVEPEIFWRRGGPPDGSAKGDR